MTAATSAVSGHDSPSITDHERLEVDRDVAETALAFVRRFV
jgi:hypothetical protein